MPTTYTLIDTITDGKARMKSGFNAQRNKPLDTDLEEGDTWEGHPTYPVMLGESFLKTMNRITLKIVVEGDDLKIYRQVAT